MWLRELAESMKQEAVRKAITTTNRWTLVGSVERSVIIRLNLKADCGFIRTLVGRLFEKKNLRGFKKIARAVCNGI